MAGDMILGGCSVRLSDAFFNSFWGESICFYSQYTVSTIVADVISVHSHICASQAWSLTQYAGLAIMKDSKKMLAHMRSFSNIP